jgi:pteridine reductase
LKNKKQSHPDKPKGMPHKSALVTGAAARLGKSIALRLAKLGYSIALHHNDSINEAEKTRVLIEDLGVRCSLYKCDFSKEKDTEMLMEKILKDFSGLELLVNNASIFNRSAMTETDTALLNLTLNINLKAPYILSREFAKRVKKGQIINILDTKISKNEYKYSIYTLTKKALAELTLMSAKELGPFIRVNGICPGLILEPKGKTLKYLDELAKSVPLKRRGKPEDIADAVEFLVTNEYVTGQFIFVDGGQHL